MLDRANSFRQDIGDHEQLLGVEGRIQAVLAAVQMGGAVEGPLEPEGIDVDGDEDEQEGKGVGEEEDRDDIEKEEMGEVVMRALTEELQNKVAGDVEVQQSRIDRVVQKSGRPCGRRGAQLEILFIVNLC